MTAGDTHDLPNGRRGRYCGLVTLRQQPSTAHGVILLKVLRWETAGMQDQHSGSLHSELAAISRELLW